jgi:glycosyltransferase involved in cell wall biosynthesis
MTRLAPPERLTPLPRETVRPVVFDTRVVTGSGGGPDKTILNSPRFLDPLGYTMLCGYLHPPDDPGFAELERKAARYNAPLISIPDRGPLDTSVVSALLRVCRRYKVAVWHGHDYKTNALGLLLKRFHRMRLVTTVHGWVHHTARTPVYYKIDKWCLRRYERVFCVSTDLYQECREIGVPESRCELLDNGIDTVEYTRRQSVSDAKAALGFPPSDLLIGGVGRLEPEKGFDVLIRAVHRLTSSGLLLRVVIVGEGNERQRLAELAAELGIADRVHLAGWQSDVRAYFEAMDVFALSSFREGLPNVLLEAMALEVPAVATRIAGIPRLIDDGTNGRLVEPNDLDDLTRGLSDLLRHDTTRAAYRTAARQTILERFSFGARMERMKRVYDELLNRAPHEVATR